MTHSQTQGADGAGTFDHEFKSHPDVFWPAARGEKTFEYRRDDRGGYEVGQTVRLRCFDPAIGYEDAAPLDRRITNILRGGEFELPQGYCILSLAPLADGAGTKTGRPQPLTILYTNWRGETAVRRILIDAIAYGNEALGLAYGRNERHPEEQWLLSATDADKGERRTFAMAGIKAWGQAAVDAALAASTPASTIPPDVRSLLRTARSGLATYGAGAFEGTILQIDAILAYDPIFPAPAATPGVPDSLRALSEAATKGPWEVIVGDDYCVESKSYPPHPTHSPVVVDGGNWIAVGNRPDDFGKANAELIAASVNYVRALIAAQPAGQAGDAGAWTEHSPQEIVRRTRCQADNSWGQVQQHIWRRCCDLILERLGKPAPPSDPAPSGQAEG